jgi:hypothetical protein
VGLDDAEGLPEVLRDGEASMKRRPDKQTPPGPFEIVKAVGLALPDVVATTKYDGSPVLKAGGSFMAGLATHRSAEPETLVVRVSLEERDGLIEDAPETYYVTDYYRRYPIVLVRLSRIDRDALRDLLSVSWRLALAKAPKRPRLVLRRVAGRARAHCRRDRGSAP